MRRPPFLEQSGLVPPPRGRRAANAARRKEMRWNRDVGLTIRQGIRLTRRQDEAWLAGFAPEDRDQMARWLEPFDDEAMAADLGSFSAERKAPDGGGAMSDR